MIGSIDHKADIELFLEAEEVERLKDETIEGVLVKIQKPKMQGTITLCVNSADGVKIDDKQYWGVKDGFHLDVFMGAELYQQLRQRGIVGVRQRMRDRSKIHIYDRTRLQGMDAIRAEHLEFYHDNKEKLRIPGDYHGPRLMK